MQSRTRPSKAAKLAASSARVACKFTMVGEHFGDGFVVDDVVVDLVAGDVVEDVVDAGDVGDVAGNDVVVDAGDVEYDAVVAVDDTVLVVVVVVVVANVFSIVTVPRR